jgi:hypothetical protein
MKNFKKIKPNFKLAVLDANEIRNLELKKKHNFDAFQLFKNSFKQVDKDLQFTDFKVFKNEFPADLKDFDGYLISGN